MHGVCIIKKERKQKLVLTVTLVGRISLIMPTFEEHNKVKQDMTEVMYTSKERYPGFEC